MLVYVSTEINSWIAKHFPNASDLLKNQIAQTFELWWDHSGSFTYASNRTLKDFSHVK